MRFGGQTVTFVTVIEDPDNRGPYNRPAEIRTEVAVQGCHWRPLKTEERTTADDGTITSEEWKLTAPPAGAVLAATPNDELKVDGVTYQIVGAIRPHRDLQGRINHVSLTARRVD